MLWNRECKCSRFIVVATIVKNALTWLIYLWVVHQDRWLGLRGLRFWQHIHSFACHQSISPDLLHLLQHLFIDAFIQKCISHVGHNIFDYMLIELELERKQTSLTSSSMSTHIRSFKSKQQNFDARSDKPPPECIHRSKVVAEPLVLHCVRLNWRKSRRNGQTYVFPSFKTFPCLLFWNHSIHILLNSYLPLTTMPTFEPSLFVVEELFID